jgi:heat-inducible transcriptional repressor
MAARDHHEEELETRLRDVLREIVVRYVSSGEPVSSRTLARSGCFDLSPATLRNVMADLEDLGYLQQPHTSAGRIPTDLGYRFFINHLMKGQRLTSAERAQIDADLAQTSELDEMMHAASRLLSKLSNQVGVAFLPSLHQIVMRSVDFIRVSENRLLVVIVATNGVVVNKIVESNVDASRDDLEKISRYITGEFSGMPLARIRDRLASSLTEEQLRHDSLLAKAVALGANAVEDILPAEHELFVEGATSMLYKPEFSDALAMRKTFLAFEQKEKLVEILNGCLSEEGLHILVGSESKFTGSYNFSIVATSYGSTTPLGLIGVIGPTRMEYARMTTLVDYLGRVLGRKIEESRQEQSQ